MADLNEILSDDSSDDNGAGNDNINEKQAGKRPGKGTYKPRKKRALAWKYFTEFVDEARVRKGRCMYCNRAICCNSSRNGTSGLNKHLERCDDNPENIDKKQSKLSAKENDDGQTSLKPWKFDPSKVRKSLIKMIIVDELPFSFVEREGFREFVDLICPNVKIPSRFTVARDIVDFYMEEKKKLKGFFIKSKPRVSFTTDTWTSNQRINYMCLTAHFIDNEWNYHKRLINFKPILSHRGVNIATEIEKCLYEWGIENVMVFTMDNASSNDVAVRELSNRLPNLLSKGKYLHVRCIAHIINLIVQDGLKAQEKIIDCIRNAVKYVRQSPSRLATFKSCVKEKSIDSKALLSLDVCTRWNSTCEMLEKAIVYEMAFDAYALKDSNYRKDLDDIPDRFYWSYAKQIVALLMIFKHKTEQVSCSNYVTAHEVFSQIVDISESLEKKHKESSDLGLGDFRPMVSLMQDKFDKYFEDTEKKNMLFQFANILDPRYKLELVVFESEKTVDLMKASRPEMTDDEYQDYVDTMVEDVRKEMELLVKEYETLYPTGSRNPVRGASATMVSNRHDNNSFLARFEQRRGGGVQSSSKKTELEKYLKDDIEGRKDPNFDILQWWKGNSSRYPTLSKMAKDILAIPVSTVASESAFSTGGRVVDSYRSSLSPKIVEALICTQDWVRPGKKQIHEVENSENFDELAKDVEETIESMVVD